jgi:peptide deformylase
MTVKTILVADESTLRGEATSMLRLKCRKIIEFGSELGQVVQDLRDTLHADTLSVGLAAPQIGYSVCVAVVNLNKNEAEDLVLINPEVLSESGDWDTKFESCMSVPHKRGEVKRRKKLRLKYMDLNGIEREYSATGFEARVMLHEIDHLNGVLFVDRMAEGAKIEDTDLFRKHGID